MNTPERPAAYAAPADAVPSNPVPRLVGWYQALLAGLWFGVVCGLIEGAVQLFAQAFIDCRYVSVHILWVAPCLYGTVFALAGSVAGLLGSRLLPRYSASVLLLLFIFLTMLDPLSILLQPYAAIYAILVLAAGLAVVVWRQLLRRLDRVYGFIGRTAAWLAGVAVAAALVIPVTVHLRESRAVEALRAAAPDSPNVVIVVIDALRADHTSAQGYARDTTPFLDGFAQQGIYFKRAYSASSWSLPSHVSLLTGTTYDRHHVGWHNNQGLRDYKGRLLSEVLRDHGYRTGAFPANIFWVTHDRLGRGFIHFDDFFYNFSDAVLRTMYGRAFEEYVLQKIGFEDIPARRHAADINRAFLKWAGRERGRPFFALLNYMDVHDPYLPPEPYRSMYSTSDLRSGVINWRVGRSDPELDAAQLAAEVAAYDGGINYVDEQIRLLVDALGRLDATSNTLLVITSDHGESFGEHGLLLHGHSLYQEQLHVPLLLVWPGHIQAGQRVAIPVSNASIAATILDLLQIEHPLPGSEPSLAGSIAQDRPPVLAHVEQMPWVPERSPAATGDLETVIRDEWQLILHSVDSPQLFNLAQDPAQENNLAGRPDAGTRIGELTRLLRDRR